MILNRRTLLKSGAAAGLAAALPISALPIAPLPARAAETITGVTYLTPSYKALMWSIGGFNERLAEGLGGSLDFHDSGTLMKADEQIAGLRSRVIDYMFHTTTYITRSFNIIGLLGLPSLVGELYENGDRMAMGSPLFQLMADEMAKENIRVLTLGGGMIEPQYIWSAKEPITSLDQLSGRKVRVVGYEASTALEKFGVVPVRIPSSETYLALQRGTVDAVVANISTIVARNLQEQLKYCYKLPVTAFAIGAFMLQDRYEALEEADRQAFDTASQWYDEESAKQVNSVFYPDEYWPRITEAGIEPVAPSAEDKGRFEEVSGEVWEWWKGEVGEEIGQRAIDLALGRST